MREDAVVEVIRYDEAVIQYGNHLCRKYTSEHHAAQVRAQLRAFGKLILTAKEIDSSVSNMYDLLDARNVPLIIEAINKIAGLDSKTGLYRAPAATSLGTELKRIWYIFGEPSQYHAQKTFQACSLIRKLSEESGIPNSELMRTRLLRQHLATETASHNIDSKLENRLSDFMSHNRKIHDVHYVLTKKKDDIMKVSTLLENFSSTKNLPSTSCNSENMAENNRLSNSERTTSNVEEESNYELSSCSDSENEEENLSQAEINLILGKKSRRVPWSKREIQLLQETFSPEIDHNEEISKSKVQEFYYKNRVAMNRRTPHLIIQKIKAEQKKNKMMRENLKPKKERYSIEEQEVLEETVARHLQEGSYPSLRECSYVIETNEVLSSRSPSAVKTFVYNSIKKRRSI
ncbi:uncharacterized protein LOC123322340 [Coccinella septempunctata]|uniref:uncharacterized protein LOC123322340 n=1 Tax=Coccinella septempunctata TaxID=41139 RepID=UPI001D082D0C|nr:uncharacterized protein LOC123322340 [Coccinella septempunctata]